MKAPIPSLSLAGYVSNPREAVDLILSHFFLANANQTTIYRGEVKTAQVIIQQHANDPSTAASEMEIALDSLLRKYYTDTSLSITSKLVDAANSASAVEFVVSGTVIDNGVPYQLNKIAEMKNGVFIKFVEINNG